MPTHYDDDEYKGSEHATDVFKAPKPEPIPETEGQKLEKRPEDYIDTGELNEDGEPLHWSGWPLHLLGKVGDAFESVDKAVLGRIGTEDANLYKARRGTIDALSEQHFALGLLGEIFIPDTVDIATAGLAYIPNRFRKLGKAGVKLWAKLKKGGMAADSVRLSKLEAQKLFGIKDGSYSFAHTGDFSKYGDELADVAAKSDIDIRNHPNYFQGVEQYPDKWQRLFLEGGYPERTYEVFQKSGIENKKFILDTWQRLGSDREAIALVGNPIYSDNTFQATRAALLPDFLEELGKVPGVKPELHHIFSLRASAPLFDGLTVGSQKWKNLIRTLVKEGVYPGNNPLNLKLIADTPHDVVHKYLDDVIGRQGEIFFNEAAIKQIQGTGRLKVARKYAALVRNSEDILIKTQKAYAVARPGRVPPASPQEIIEVLGRINPYNKYTLDEIKTTVKEIDNMVFQKSFVAGDVTPEEFTKAFDKLKRSHRWKEMGLADKMKYLQEQTNMSYEEIDDLIRTDPNFNLDDILP